MYKERKFDETNKSCRHSARPTRAHPRQRVDLWRSLRDAPTMLVANDTHCCPVAGFIFKTRDGQSPHAAECAAVCVDTPGCAYFSHSRQFMVCAYCSECNRRQRHGYTSWRVEPSTLGSDYPTPVLSAETPPLLLVAMAPGRPLILRDDPAMSTRRPSWLSTPVNLAPANIHKLPIIAKVGFLASWLKQHPEVPAGRLLVFIDGDVVWGGCTDVEERFVSLERRVGASVYFSAEFGCGGHANCSAVPPPPPWALRDPQHAALQPWSDCGPKSNGGFAPCASPPTLRYLNSGGIIGRAGAVRRLVRTVDAYTDERKMVPIGVRGGGGMDDQMAYTSHWLDEMAAAHEAGSRPSVALDYGARIFMTLPHFQSSAVRRAPPTGQLEAAWRPNKPLCFLHPAGNKQPSFAARRHGGFNYSVLGLY